MGLRGSLHICVGIIDPQLASAYSVFLFVLFHWILPNLSENGSNVICDPLLIEDETEMKQLINRCSPLQPPDTLGSRPCSF